MVETETGEHPSPLALELNAAISALNARLAVTEQQIKDIKEFAVDLTKAQKEAAAIALAAAEKTAASGIQNALEAAAKAAHKADLAADKIYLESQIASLRDTFTAQIVSQKEAIGAAIASADKAVAKAETATEKRFESVNEFRKTLDDQSKDMQTKSEANLRFTALEERLTEAMRGVNSKIDTMRASLDQQHDGLEKRLNDLSADAREVKGRGAGLNAGWVYLIGGIGLMATIISAAAIIIVNN